MKYLVGTFSSVVTWVNFLTLNLYLTVLVVFKEHWIALKLLFYCFKMASEACSLVPSDARKGACRDYSSMQPRASSWALPITCPFLHGDRLGNDRVLHLMWVISRLTETKHVPPGPIIFQSPPNLRWVMMGLYRNEPQKIIVLDSRFRKEINRKWSSWEPIMTEITSPLFLPTA